VATCCRAGRKAGPATVSPVSPSPSYAAPLTLGGAGSFAQIRPVQAPGLCLTEGRDRQGRYDDAIAALRPCPLAVPPRTFLAPASAGAVLIQWHHPTNGIGCLTVLTAGVVKGMFEPWSDCDEARSQQLFRIESVTGAHYRLRLAQAGQCLGLIGGSAAEGVEAVEKTCTSDPDQQFLVDLLPPA